ncbi:MAG TPA: glycosyltransferase family 2 protein [Cyclobacteriaceae bacterium]|nr:glycosyltransferase family 2 protein [Cyclobacteriaceae bacterium]
MEKEPLVGIAIAVHNGIERTRECLLALDQTHYQRLFICVVDDGSVDDTWSVLSNEFPHVKAVRGDGNLWWTGGTNLAIRECLKVNCELVVLLNPDCIVEPGTITALVTHALQYPDTVVASVVVDQTSSQKVWWAGTIWGPLKGIPFVWTLRYRYKREHGYKVSDLPSESFPTAETGGRGVLIPKGIFEAVGLFDEAVFPHYAADNDFGLRVHEAGYNIVVTPHARVGLYVDNTGLNWHLTLRQLPNEYFKRMFSRKHGEFLHCSWHLLRRHVPWYAFLPSLGFWHALSLWRFFTSSLRTAFNQ